MTRDGEQPRLPASSATNGKRRGATRLSSRILCETALVTALAGATAPWACSPPAGSPPKAAVMPVSQSQQVPYDITVRIWRDEQPGDDPTLNLSARFTPRESQTAWQQPRLQRIELQADGQRWMPRASSLTPTAGEGFEITAQGEATLAAGARASGSVTIHTASGSRDVSLPATEVERVS